MRVFQGRLLTLDHDANIHVLHIKRYDRGLLKVFDQTRLYSESITKDKNFLLNIEKHINESKNEDHDLFLESILNPEKKFNQDNISVVIWILYDGIIKNLSFMERYELIRTKDLITNKLGYKNFHIQYIKVDANKVVKIANGS